MSALSIVMLSAQITPREGPVIVKDLADIVRAGLAPPEVLECLAEEHVSLDQVLATERLDLGPKGLKGTDEFSFEKAVATGRLQVPVWPTRLRSLRLPQPQHRPCRIHNDAQPAHPHHLGDVLHHLRP